MSETIVMTKEELEKNYVSIKLYELSKAFHDEKCAEYFKLCYDYNKLKAQVEQLNKEAIKKFVEILKNKSTIMVNEVQFTFTISQEMLDETLRECGIND